MFDSPVVGAGAEFLVVADAVEFQQPVLESGRGVELPTRDLTGLGVPGDHGFGTHTAGGGAHPNDVGRCRLGLMLSRESAMRSMTARG